jgi:hypothetical protein
MDAVQPEKFIPQRPFGTAAERARRSLNAKRSNSLAGFSHTQLRNQGPTFAEFHDTGDESDIRAFELGAVLAQSPERYTNFVGLTSQETKSLLREFGINGRSHDKIKRKVLTTPDETVINGARFFMRRRMRLKLMMWDLILNGGLTGAQMKFHHEQDKSFVFNQYINISTVFPCKRVCEPSDISQDCSTNGDITKVYLPRHGVSFRY